MSHQDVQQNVADGGNVEQNEIGIENKNISSQPTVDEIHLLTENLNDLVSTIENSKNKIKTTDMSSLVGNQLMTLLRSQVNALQSMVDFGNVNKCSVEGCHPTPYSSAEESEEEDASQSEIETEKETDNDNPDNIYVVNINGIDSGYWRNKEKMLEYYYTCLGIMRGSLLTSSLHLRSEYDQHTHTTTFYGTNKSFLGLFPSWDRRLCSVSWNTLRMLDN